MIITAGFAPSYDKVSITMILDVRVVHPICLLINFLDGPRGLVNWKLEFYGAFEESSVST